MFQLNVLVGTEPTLQAYLSHLNDVVSSQECTKEDLGTWTRILLDHLTQHVSGRTADRVLRGLVQRMLVQFVDNLDSLPGQSVAHHAIPSDILDRVLSSTMVTETIREVVVNRSYSSRSPLTKGHRSSLIEAAMRTRDEEAITNYLRLPERSALMDAEEVTDTELEDREQLSSSRSQSQYQESPRVLPPPRLSVPKRLERVRYLLAYSSEGLGDLHKALAPYLASPARDSDIEAYSARLRQHRYAWSKLLHAMAVWPEISSEDMMEAWLSLPSTAKTAHVISPLMRGLCARKQYADAWQVWSSYINFAAQRPPDEVGIYIDERTIVDATAAYAVKGMSEQFAFVDYWGKRPRSTRSQSSAFEQSIQLDAFNVNALLRLCRRAGLPSVAFRLLAASYPRWGVLLDHVSLALILDTARKYARSSGYVPPNSGLQHALKMFFAELSAAKIFHSPRDEGLGAVDDTTRFDAYEADGFSKGGPGVLLDPPGFHWYHAHGTVKPYEIAKTIFRQVILGNYPHLQYVVNPLDRDATWDGDSWYHRYFGHESSPAKLQIKFEDRLPLPGAKYTHIIPGVDTWQAYILFLGYFGMIKQIPLALAWMKMLDIRPTWISMLYGLTFIKEVQGEPSRVRGNRGEWKYATDEEIVRDFLSRWLGEGRESVPEPSPSAMVRINSHTREPGDLKAPDGLDEERRRSIVPTPVDVLNLRMWYIGQGRKFIYDGQ
ncbi:hypothetical protein BD324DRAFT_625445 [Kockovaella imperatae]|uniref:Uncharacterized protein n=1 Tax=Kockovaella imperatae TaxID=4999 RepID=A0A1Y1UGS1_9TREE|nr:hypothetical protein BD324DRAFT_625445 [Kockovaella imperatae]ORX37261.1 hypothetical protein BD324DRAFT_625445 [Kockovaella imperatae]